MHRLLARILSVPLILSALRAADDLPRDWIDPDTGHRIIRLSTEPGSSTLYFHDNAYSPRGDKLIFNSPSGIVLLDVTKLGTEPPKPEVAVPGGRGGYFARRTPEIYFVRGGGGGFGRGTRGEGATPPGAPVPRDVGAPPVGGAPIPVNPDRRGGEVFAYHLETKETRKISHASRTLINCDETFTLVTATAEDPSGKNPKPPPREARPQLARMFPGKTMEELTPEQRYAVTKEEGLARRTVNPPGMAFTFTNLKTGEARTVGYQYGSLNHMQFSPTDPNLLLYCHEGTWHEVDRVWTIRTDGSAMTLRHKRTMDMEIAGHEFWSHDGQTIWFDLQTPRSQVFWIAGVELATGKETRYPIDRDAWSVHYNISRDSTLFMGDGGDETQVAFSKNGMWINLFRPQSDGTLRREKLVNMAKHNYVTGRGGIEPNGSITPDNRWVVFSGNFHGARHVYAVEVFAARKPKP
ncbi:MAG: oligogalacturonate lyase [Verrucomicrobia bacterium]|nr:oligogalacturonate lyase [Verrucomicrobiota bacterium]